MEGSEPEVLVVGAGPAGVAAAITAADHGLDVLLADKATFPRDKACGDGLTTAALRRLEALGLPRGAIDAMQPVREVVLVGPDGRRIGLTLPYGGSYATVSPRAELDDALVQLARQRGVTVREGAAVGSVSIGGDDAKVLFADGASVRARHVVAADGHYSAVRRALHRDPPDLGSWHAFRQYFSGVHDERLWVLFEEDLLPGYAWVFPLPGGRANVGYGVLRGPQTTGRRLATLWRDLLTRPVLREILGPAAVAEGTVRAWPIPGALRPDSLADGPVLFVGDAAGVADPLTGEGIGQALETGVLAAEAIIGGGDAGEIASRYRRIVHRSLARDLRFAAGIQRLLRRPVVARAALRAVDTSDWTRRNFARWMFEDYPRALVLTPDRWRRHAFAPPAPFGTPDPGSHGTRS
ncbi:MAG: NAD(P)/FAD-dependent oxidoreductase [Acidimicrobiia bacterium]